ncbi:TPA: hypothetical protein MHS90_19935 [Klebsiella pneumoniae]|nr:hypothetical protein [Klebsiella pneumoniae]
MGYFSCQCVNLYVRIQDSGFRIQDSGFRIQDSGFRIQDSGFRALLWLGLLILLSSVYLY